jgi:ATP-dependent exoDNAse (exonuclease V) alpha subunit
MLPLNLLGEVSSKIKIAKNDTSSSSFADVSVILVGDFHQLDAVLAESLLCDPNKKFRATGKSLAAQQRAINNAKGLVAFNEEFINVIELTQQMRQAGDVRYHELLKRLRTGKGNREDHDLLMNCVIKSDTAMPNIFRTLLITTTNSVKDVVNFNMIREFSSLYSQNIVKIIALDSFNKNSKTKMTNDRRKLFLQLPLTKTKNVPGVLHCVLGMPIMVTINVCVSLGITNGSTGYLREIILHPIDLNHLSNEDSSTSMYVCRKLPLALIVDFEGCSKFNFPNFPENCFPIFPHTERFIYQFSIGKRITIERKQFPIIPRFATTNYKCQGDTLPCAIVDLPEGPARNSASTSYVSFSRVRSSSDVYVLRPFPITVLQNGVKYFKQKGIDRLKVREQKTIEDMKCNHGKLAYLKLMPDL